MSIQICPDCGKLLMFEMRYIAGQPSIRWYCSCGYDSDKQTSYATNRTEYEKNYEEWEIERRVDEAFRKALRT